MLLSCHCPFLPQKILSEDAVGYNSLLLGFWKGSSGCSESNRANNIIKADRILVTHPNISQLFSQQRCKALEHFKLLDLTQGQIPYNC